MPFIGAAALGVGLAVAAFLPFTSVILASRGFTPGEIGLVAAGQSLAYLLAVPAWGHLADVVLGRRRGLIASALGGALVIALAGLPLPAVLFAALVVMFSTMQAGWPALVDALAINAVRGDIRAYGRIRVMSSVSFAAGSAAMGFVFNALGYGPAFLTCAAAAVGIAVAARFIPDVARANLHEMAGTARPRGGSFGVALRVAPRLWALLAVAACCYVAMSAGGTFLPLRIVALGGQPSDVALAWGIGGLTEVPMMLFGAAVIARVGVRSLIAGSALGYAACLVGLGLATSPAVIIAIRAASGFAFAGLAIGMVISVSRLLPDRLQATGQGLYQVVAFGIAGVIANAVGGQLFAAVPAELFFGGAGALCAAGGLLAIVILAPNPHRRVTPEASVG